MEINKSNEYETNKISTYSRSKHKKNNSTNSNSKDCAYKWLGFIENRFGDPITCINISGFFLIIGTMLGRILIHNISINKSKILAESSSENITSISFISEFSFYISVGDDEVIYYNITKGLTSNSLLANQMFQLDFQAHHIRNYDTESEHIKYCDSTYTAISKKYFFKIFLKQPEEGNVVIIRVNSPYEIKDLENRWILKGDIEMTNYIIPFDFNFYKFLWVEFLSDSDRNICVYSFNTSYFPATNVEELNNNNTESPLMNSNCNSSGLMWKCPVTKVFGHISFCRWISFLNNNWLFIVRDIKQCEIRKIDNSFICVYSFKHWGDEVISFDIFTTNEKEDICKSDTYKDNNQNFKLKIIERDPHESHPIDNNNNNKNLNSSISKDSDNKEYKNWSICLWDIDGKINEYKNNSISTIVELKDIEGIQSDHKSKGLFSLGYPYWIKCYRDIIAFTTDFGVYIIQKK